GAFGGGRVSSRRYRRTGRRRPCGTLSPPAATEIGEPPAPYGTGRMPVASPQNERNRLASRQQAKTAHSAAPAAIADGRRRSPGAAADRLSGDRRYRLSAHPKQGSGPADDRRRSAAGARHVATAKLDRLERAR